MPIAAFKHSLASVGYAPDLSADELPVPAWTDGANIRFVNGAPRTVEGIDVAMTATTTIIHAFNTSSPTSNFWVYATLTDLYATDGTTHAKITRLSATTTTIPYTATANENWTSASFGQYAILNDSADAPQQWDLSLANEAVNLTNWPATWTAQSVRTYRNYLIAMDITIGGTRYPSLVAWSDAAAYGTLPATWVPSTTNDAGDNNLEDTPGFIIDGLALGGSFIIYKEDAVWAMTYTAGAQVMAFRKMFDGVGLLAKRCVVEFDNKHFFVGRGDIYIHDGTGLQSVAAKRVRDVLFDSIANNPTTYSRIFVAIDRARREIWVCYPDGGDYPTKALVWNYEDNVWYPPRILPETAHIAFGIVEPVGSVTTFDASVGATFDADTGEFGSRMYSPSQTRLLACIPGQASLYQCNEGTTVLGATIAHSLTRKLLPFDGKDALGQPAVWSPSMKVVRRVWLDATGTGVIRVYIGTQETESGTTSWHGPFAIDLATQQFAWCLVRGRYLSIKFESDSSDAAWAMSGYSLDWEPAGER